MFKMIRRFKYLHCKALGFGLYGAGLSPAWTAPNQSHIQSITHFADEANPDLAK